MGSLLLDHNCTKWGGGCESVQEFMSPRQRLSLFFTNPTPFPRHAAPSRTQGMEPRDRFITWRIPYLTRITDYLGRNHATSLTKHQPDRLEKRVRGSGMQDPRTIHTSLLSEKSSQYEKKFLFPPRPSALGAGCGKERSSVPGTFSSPTFKGRLDYPRGAVMKR